MDKNTREALTRICLEIKELLGKEEQQEEKVKKFGTLRILGAAVPAPKEPYRRGDILGYNGKDFEIGDTVAGKELTWLRLGDIWVCDRNILQGVSWNTLNKKGFVYGKEVEIDGEKYKLRILTGSDGREYGAGCDNEWDQLMDAYKEDNNLLHYDDVYSWCQEEDYDFSSVRSLRGCSSARDFTGDRENDTFTTTGWRPVLEKLETDN